MLKKYMVILCVVLCVWNGGCADSELEEITLETSDSGEVQEEIVRTEIYVFVCGAVRNPGVYAMAAGDRVVEAINAAGGFLDDAAKEAWNQAELLRDEMKIYVPTMEEIKNQSEAGTSKININTASKEDLMELPGVGESKAEQIISYREKQGLFKCIEDIMSISGIKEGLFEKIKEYITV